MLYNWAWNLDLDFQWQNQQNNILVYSDVFKSAWGKEEEGLKDI